MLHSWNRVLRLFIVRQQPELLTRQICQGKLFFPKHKRLAVVHPASKESAAEKKMKAWGVSLTVRCFTWNIQHSACLLFFVWCLLRCTNTSLWQKSNGWALTDGGGWRRCSKWSLTSDAKSVAVKTGASIQMWYQTILNVRNRKNDSPRRSESWTLCSGLPCGKLLTTAHTQEPLYLQYTVYFLFSGMTTLTVRAWRTQPTSGVSVEITSVLLLSNHWGGRREIHPVLWTWPSMANPLVDWSAISCLPSC